MSLEGDRILELLKPGEIAVNFHSVLFDTNIGSSLLGVLYRLNNDCAKKYDLPYLLTPGLIDSIVYHDRLVIEKPHESGEIMIELKTLEKLNIVRIVEADSLIMKPLEAAGIYKYVYTKIANDPRYICIHILANPDFYYHFLKKRGLLENMEDSIVRSLGSGINGTDAKWMVKDKFLRKVDFEKVLQYVMHRNPLQEVQLESYFWSLTYKCPVISIHPWMIIDYTPDSSLALVGNEISNEQIANAKTYVIRKLEKIRKELTQRLQTEGMFLFKLEENEAEMPLTLALALDRIKEKRVSPSLLWDSLRGLHNDKSTMKFREFLKRFEIAVKTQTRKEILKCQADVEYAADGLMKEYSCRRPFETRHFTKVPSLAINMILQRYDNVVEGLAEKTLESAPAIAERLGIYSHIDYMTRLGKAGIKSRPIKRVLSERFGDIGKLMAERYLYISNHSDITVKVLNHYKKFCR